MTDREPTPDDTTVDTRWVESPIHKKLNLNDVHEAFRSIANEYGLDITEVYVEDGLDLTFTRVVTRDEYLEMHEDWKRVNALMMPHRFEDDTDLVNYVLSRPDLKTIIASAAD